MIEVLEPQIIFIQEAIPKFMSLLKISNGTKHFEFSRRSENVPRIAWDSNLLEENVEESLEILRLKPKEFSEHRVDVRVLHWIKPTTMFRIITVCYHGEWNSGSEGNQRCFEKMKEFLRNLEEKHPRDAILVGGDWNMVLTEGSIRSYDMCPRSPGKRTIKGAREIDWILYRNVSLVKGVDVNFYERGFWKKRGMYELDGTDYIDALDHDPQTAIVHIPASRSLGRVL
eukprot:TRINITY_DN3703_c0_g2_i1.p1 TRINITY_DN3703_c0_g2~~TRINITY_DN3703_c0_g2_i1.p1  ORF type:complete len:228 (-),score=36.03 TRINITY_DN3703_c0_g2_i1:14-697(-)